MQRLLQSMQLLECEATSIQGLDMVQAMLKRLWHIKKRTTLECGQAMGPEMRFGRPQAPVTTLYLVAAGKGLARLATFQVADGHVRI